MSCYGRSKCATKTQKVWCVVKFIPLIPVKITYHVQVVSRVFLSFLTCDFFFYLIISRKKKGGVFKTIHLFVGRVSLAMEGKSVLPMHKVILEYKRKYTLKYPNGLIICVCRIS